MQMGKSDSSSHFCVSKVHACIFLSLANVHRSELCECVCAMRMEHGLFFVAVVMRVRRQRFTLSLPYFGPIVVP